MDSSRQPPEPSPSGSTVPKEGGAEASENSDEGIGPTPEESQVGTPVESSTNVAGRARGTATVEAAAALQPEPPIQEEVAPVAEPASELLVPAAVEPPSPSEQSQPEPDSISRAAAPAAQAQVAQATVAPQPVRRNFLPLGGDGQGLMPNTTPGQHFLVRPELLVGYPGGPETVVSGPDRGDAPLASSIAQGTAGRPPAPPRPAGLAGERVSVPPAGGQHPNATNGSSVPRDGLRGQPSVAPSQRPGTSAGLPRTQPPSMFSYPMPPWGYGCPPMPMPYLCSGPYCPPPPPLSPLLLPPCCQQILNFASAAHAAAAAAAAATWPALQQPYYPLPGGLAQHRVPDLINPITHHYVHHQQHVAGSNPGGFYNNAGFFVTPPQPGDNYEEYSALMDAYNFQFINPGVVPVTGLHAPFLGQPATQAARHGLNGGGLTPDTQVFPIPMFFSPPPYPAEDDTGDDDEDDDDDTYDYEEPRPAPPGNRKF